MYKMQPIESSESIKDEVNESDEIFQSKDEMHKSISRFCYGDLYVIGRIWIQTLKAVLVGARMCLIPVVHAARAEEPPKKPPPMRYKDLPIYQSPHHEYKTYLEDKEKCPDANVKLLHRALLPHVKNYRQMTKETYCSLCCNYKTTKKEMCQSIKETKDDIKKYMRDPNNLTVRQGVVGAGTLTGFLLGGGGGIPRRMFFTGLGALATGALCFPKETDEMFREVCYYTAKAAIALYNTTCGKNFALRERVPCKRDFPPEPPYRKPHCPK